MENLIPRTNVKRQLSNSPDTLKALSGMSPDRPAEKKKSGATVGLCRLMFVRNERTWHSRVCESKTSQCCLREVPLVLSDYHLQTRWAVE